MMEPMRLSEARRIIEGVTFEWPLRAWRPALEIYEGRSKDSMELKIALRATPHRDTGIPSEIHLTVDVSGICTEDDLLRMVLVLTKRSVEHEVLESIHYKGVRAFDPHGREPR